MELITVRMQAMIITALLLPLFSCGENIRRFKLDGAANLELVYVKGGSGIMGSHDSEISKYINHARDEAPERKVNVIGFWIGRYEVRQDQFECIMGYNPSKFKKSNAPVDSVSWKKAMEYCQKLSNSTGQNFTLPTEAQWEYACRGGVTSPWYCFKDGTDYDSMYFFWDKDYLSKYMWYAGNSMGSTHAVGQKVPNKYGLYDMLGNVMEWCLSEYRPYPYEAGDGRNDTIRDDGKTRVARGGSWALNMLYCRSASRHTMRKNSGTREHGFRVIWTGEAGKK